MGDPLATERTPTDQRDVATTRRPVNTASVSATMVRLAFFACALVVSPLLAWLLRVPIYMLDDTTGGIWMIGLPPLLTILAGGLMNRSLWELILGASISASVALLSLYIAIFAGCQGSSDCL